MEENKKERPSRGRASFESKRYDNRKSEDSNSRFDKKRGSNFDRNKEEGEKTFKGKRKFEKSNRRKDGDSKPFSTSQDKDQTRDFKRSNKDSRGARRFDRERGSNFNRHRDEGERNFNKDHRKNDGESFSNYSEEDSPRDRRGNRDWKSRNRKDDRGRSNFANRKRPFEEKSEKEIEELKAERFKNKPGKDVLRSKHYSKKKQLEHAKMVGPADGILRLNKYISNTGACSRREADNRIADGRITVNGTVVTEVGTKVNIKDKVCMDGTLLHPEAKVYIALNKPKDFVTTLDDPMGRKTVIDLIKNACKERVYPVGRLDRMTTGVLLFTNDGDLTKRLTHPSYNKKKIYHAFLDREITQEELDKVLEGLELEDGLIKADAISFTDSEDKKQVGLEIHSGKNRIVRRIFEHLGYEVEKLDRVFFAGITKKNMPRGKWRFLSEEEVRMLKNF
ncbi:pseudouridine synthase [Marinifilum sp. RC60d5]|uniref:pseudouridine synthase n=1 Tax=Marinifilum sp. RC60d5 TaxID=3458414 RepID=UPI0040369D91